MQNVKLNDKSPYVQYVRLALKRMGYDSDETNDTFDNALYDEIIRLQTLNGLTADGEVGESTWNILLPYLKGYTTEPIRQSTTYSSLAKKYETTVSAIRTANPTYLLLILFLNCVTGFANDNCNIGFYAFFILTVATA